MAALSWLSTYPTQLRQRSFEAELLDADNILQADLWQNLHELEVINQKLGGYGPTLKGLRQLMSGADRTWHIMDVGCGGGDTLAVIAKWAAQHGFRVKLTGVDLLPDCIQYAKKNYGHLEIDWHDCAYAHYKGPSPDIVISALFCHHLDTEQFQHYLNWVRTTARFGFVLNDLHRHPLAYYGIGVLTHFLSRSPLVKNDAALSVWRGFSRQELQTALKSAGLCAKTRWVWAFRWMVVGYV